MTEPAEDQRTGDDDAQTIEHHIGGDDGDGAAEEPYDHRCCCRHGAEEAHQHRLGVDLRIWHREVPHQEVPAECQHYLCDDEGQVDRSRAYVPRCDPGEGEEEHRHQHVGDHRAEDRQRSVGDDAEEDAPEESVLLEEPLEGHLTACSYLSCTWSTISSASRAWRKRPAISANSPSSSVVRKCEIPFLLSRLSISG